MIRTTKLNLIGVLFFLTSCSTSMSPFEVNNTLPNFTKSKFISQSQAEEITKSNKAKYLVKNRKYVAPIGFSTVEDLRNGARGIDEWVKIDGGNAYVLKNFEWTTVDQNGSTQLRLEFDTMLFD